MNKAEEDIRMSKHVPQIKACCYLPAYGQFTFKVETCLKQISIYSGRLRKIT